MNVMRMAFRNRYAFFELVRGKKRYPQHWLARLHCRAISILNDPAPVLEWQDLTQILRAHYLE